jgi:hypothetical protein
MSEASEADARRQALADLDGARDKLQTEATGLRSEIERANLDAGAVVLAAELSRGGDPKAALAEVTRRTVRLAAVEAAIAAANAERPRAEVALWRAQAAEMRAQAAQLDADADVRQVRTDALLADLAEHEGCPYAPKWVPGQRLFQTLEELGPAPLMQHRPRTLAMRREAEVLRAQADDLERRALAQEARIGAP